MPKQSLDEMAHELMGHLEVLTKRFLLPEKTAQLSRSETAVLRHLSDHGAATMSDLSSFLGLALSSTTGVVDALAERKLVERKRGEDRRQVRVALTRAGSRMHDAFMGARCGLGIGMLEPLTDSERKRLLEYFRKMTSELLR
ncbi:MAG TPA: MarR family transcriptional regulator [Thermoanaerobaculia bacterium]|jgi:DNA-binding MarR family transcriptional regulator